MAIGVYSQAYFITCALHMEFHNHLIISHHLQLYHCMLFIQMTEHEMLQNDQCVPSQTILGHFARGLSLVHNTTLKRASRAERNERRIVNWFYARAIRTLRRASVTLGIGQSFIPASSSQRLANQIAVFFVHVFGSDTAAACQLARGLTT